MKSYIRYLYSWVSLVLLFKEATCDNYGGFPSLANLPSNGPILPVSPILPYDNSDYSQSVAHIHGYVEKPVEYFYKSYKLQPTVTNVRRLDLVPHAINMQGVLRVPQVQEVKSVDYIPKPVQVQSYKVVPTEKTIQSLAYRPTIHTATQLEYVPDTKSVKSVVYNPHLITQYGLNYVPKEQIMSGTKLNVAQELVPGYQVVPKMYTGTGVRYNYFQYPVNSYRYEPRQYSVKSLDYIPTEQQQVGLKLFAKDYIVKTYKPIIAPSLATYTHTGEATRSGPIIRPITIDPRLYEYANNLNERIKSLAYAQPPPDYLNSANNLGMQQDHLTHNYPGVSHDQFDQNNGPHLPFAHDTAPQSFQTSYNRANIPPTIQNSRSFDGPNLPSQGLSDSNAYDPNNPNLIQFLLNRGILASHQGNAALPNFLPTSHTSFDAQFNRQDQNANTYQRGPTNNK
ncbi:unnamed protein product [Gordionus sp. m RMFG-2023]